MLKAIPSVISHRAMSRANTIFLYLIFTLAAGFTSSVFGQGETCESALAVTPGSYSSNGPSTGGGAVNSCIFPLTGDATNADWYLYTATDDGIISISSCSGGADTRLSVFTGICGSLICYAANDDECEITPSGSPYASQIMDLVVAEGESYYIQWDDRWSPSAFDWSFSFTAGSPPPVNDECVNATPIGISPFGECASYSVFGNNSGANDSQGSPSCDDSGPWPDVFFSFNSSGYSNLNLSFQAGTIQDRIVEVFEGCGGASIQCVIGLSSVELAVTPNTDYIIRVSTNLLFGNPGSFSLCLEASDLPPCTDPEITAYAYASGGDVLVPIEGCIVAGTPYNIAVLITDEFGNNAYNFTFNDSPPFLYNTGDGNVLGIGPFTTTSPVTITATGVENFTCSSTVMFNPPICPMYSDECATPVNLEVNGAPVLSSNTDATPTPNLTMDCGDGDTVIQNDVWFSFVAPSSGIVTIETAEGTNSDTQMQIFDACGGTLVGCNDDISIAGGNYMSKIVLPCDSYIPGHTYLVQVDGWSGAIGTFTISATSTPCPSPVNDECADAVNIPVDGGVVEGTLSGATPNDGLTIYCGAGDLIAHNDIWFSFEAPSSGILTIETFAGTNNDTQMQIFDACGGSAIACNDDKDGPNQDYMSKIILPCYAYIPGEVYFVQVDGWNGVSGSFTISVTSTPCPPPPANDECAGAINIPVDGGVFEATNLGATGNLDILIECLNLDGDPVPVEDAYVRKDVWYSFVAPETGIITIETFSGTVFDTQLQIFEECGGAVIGCNDDIDLDNDNYMSKVILDCNSYIPGHTYLVQVDSWAAGYFGYDGGSTFTISVSTESCPAPANDSCTDAEVVVCGATYTGTTYGATFDADQEFCDVFAPGSENGGVWYEYTPTEDGSVKIELQNAAFNYSVFLYSGSCNSLSCEMGHFSGYSSSITADLLNGNTYYIYVSGASLGENGNFDLSITCLNPPANDDCSNAENLVCGGTYSGNTLSTTSYDDQSYCGGPTPLVDNLNGGVWYSYTPTDNGIVLFSISNSDFNNLIFLYTGNCEDLTCIDGDNDGPDGDNSDNAQILASVDGGQTYYLYVTGVFSERGHYTLDVVCNYCPDLNANLGDPCDDGNPDTHNDVVTEDCLCAGVPDCTNPELTFYHYAVGGDGSTPISGCIDEDEPYMLALFIVQDYGNTTYTVTFNNGNNYTYVPSIGGIGTGPHTGPIEFTVTGVENNTCSTTATFTPQICVGPPANDECVDAVAIPVDGAPVEGTNSEATPSPDISVGCGVFNDTDVQNDVWFSFVAPSSGILTIETFAGTNFDTQMQIFDACGGSLISCNDDKDIDNLDYMSKITLSCDSYTPGGIYLVQVDGWDGISGTFTISVTSTPCPAPANDEACGATPIGCSDILSQSFANATVSINDDCLGDAADIWFSFTSDGSQILTIAETSSFDATVQLFEGNDCSNLSEVGSCADAAESFTVTEPGTYYFRVRPTHVSGESGEAIVSLTCVDYDCPDQLANIGDACDDGDSSTENDIITDDCNCEGTSIYDCPDLSANFGDVCDDGNPNTIDDVVTTDCICEGSEVASGSLSGTISGWNSACAERGLVVTLATVDGVLSYFNIPGTLHSDGTFTLDGSPEIAPNTYNVLVKVEGALARSVENVVINAGLNTVLVPSIVLGDLNGDNQINIFDISQFTVSFGASIGNPSYSILADFNCDGTVNVFDVSGLNNGFGQSGDAIYIQ